MLNKIFADNERKQKNLKIILNFVFFFNLGLSIFLYYKLIVIKFK